MDIPENNGYRSNGNHSNNNGHHSHQNEGGKLIVLAAPLTEAIGGIAASIMVWPFGKAELFRTSGGKAARRKAND